MEDTQNLLEALEKHPDRDQYSSDLAHYEAIMLWWCSKIAPIITKAKGN